jgi:hypothetical protein
VGSFPCQRQEKHAFYPSRPGLAGAVRGECVKVEGERNGDKKCSIRKTGECRLIY